MLQQPPFYKATMNHSLMDLDPPGEESRSNEDELFSDFLEHATMSESTVLYRTHERKKDSKEQAVADVKKKNDVDISKVKPRKVTEFSVKRPDDEENVDLNGVLALGDKVIIVDNEIEKLKLFDSSGSYLSSTELKRLSYGITLVNENIFATCGFGNKVYVWTLRGQSIISEDEVYDVDNKAYGIHYNNTYYCVQHRYDNAVAILDSQGRQVRKIVMKEAFGKKVEFGWDIHMENETHNLYVPCMGVNRGVLCMSVEGECLWFTLLLDSWLFGIMEIHGTLCVSDKDNICLHLISKKGHYVGKLLENEELVGQPYYIDFNEHEDKLFFSHFFAYEKSDIISIYSVL